MNVLPRHPADWVSGSENVGGGFAVALASSGISMDVRGVATLGSEKRSDF
jgi:predicted phage tail protein